MIKPFAVSCLVVIASAASAQEVATPSSGSTQSPAAARPAGEVAYDKDDILVAADQAFGKGTAGLADVVERIFSDLGRPNAYIVGREGSGAVGVGLRYGKGTLFHKVEGQRTVYWTGPSLGFDVGGDASRVFTLVYQLDDTEDLFKRFPAVEGRAYFVGGVSATYHQRGRIILVPIRLGAGWRLGVNAGYLRFTKESRILPF